MKHEEYDTKRQELLYKIPEQYRKGSDELAWQMGHAKGREETLLILKAIVHHIFTTPELPASDHYYKNYVCTDCQKVNRLRANFRTDKAVGYCSDCEHPLWN